MQNSQKIDYEQPTRDTLIGIYVEASDCVIGEPSHLNKARPPELVDQTSPRPEELFGVILTVDDILSTQKSDAASQA